MIKNTNNVKIRTRASGVWFDVSFGGDDVGSQATSQDGENEMKNRGAVTGQSTRTGSSQARAPALSFIFHGDGGDGAC